MWQSPDGEGELKLTDTATGGTIQSHSGGTLPAFPIEVDPSPYVTHAIGTKSDWTAQFRNSTKGTWTRLSDGNFQFTPSTSAGVDQSEYRVSDDGGATWRVPASQPKMACIGERTGGLLYACGANFAPDMFALATSTDGESWREVLRFSDIDGPLECPADTVQATECAAVAWPAVCDALGICEPAAAPPREDRTTRDGGYYCQLGSSSPSAALPALLLIAALAWSRRRR
jgi:MYXO-CTERM domain-containing protein